MFCSLNSESLFTEHFFLLQESISFVNTSELTWTFIKYYLAGFVIWRYSYSLEGSKNYNKSQRPCRRSNGAPRFYFYAWDFFSSFHKKNEIVFSWTVECVAPAACRLLFKCCIWKIIFWLCRNWIDINSSKWIYVWKISPAKWERERNFYHVFMPCLSFLQMYQRKVFCRTWI